MSRRIRPLATLQPGFYRSTAHFTRSLLSVVPVKNRSLLVDGNQFFSGEGGGIQTTKIPGVYWSIRPMKSGTVDVHAIPLSGVTGGQ